MDEPVLKWLYDIKLAIEEIWSYFSNGFEEYPFYQENTILKRAVERNPEIIGEAMNRILKRSPELKNKITSSHAIIGLRNHIIHGYDNVSDEIIRSILTSHINPLKTEIEFLIEEQEMKR